MRDFKYIPESGLSGSGSNNSLENLFRNSSPGEKNELQVLIREHIQNSLDAFDKRKNKPEKLIFKVSRKKIDSSFFNLDELKSIFEDCRDFREIQFDNEDQKNKDKTFKKLSSSIENLSKIGNKLWAIIIEDNGCGIDGDSRAPKHTKKTAAQIITEEGDSNKFTNESRGSFGVGKLTVFSNNDTFSVFYSSRNGGKTKFIGKTKLIRMPRRSAIVSFSINDVYEIAELVKRKHGGTAVVLGALSPKTRNAQVDLYESGEVDYLVATDAIGMGLNMDINHISFAKVNKFDGRSTRPLSISEMAQIAGRAGRYKRDGSFGVTAKCDEFSPNIIKFRLKQSIHLL